MGLAENLVRILVSAAVLAGWTLFVTPNISKIIGREPTFLDTFIAYIGVFIAIYVFSTLLVRQLSHRGEEE